MATNAAGSLAATYVQGGTTGIARFAPGSAQPTKIDGTQTQLQYCCAALALDANGTLYGGLGNFDRQSANDASGILWFARAAQGDAAPAGWVSTQPNVTGVATGP